MKEIYPIVKEVIDTIQEKSQLSATPLIASTYQNIFGYVNRKLNVITEDDIVITKQEYISLLNLKKKVLLSLELGIYKIPCSIDNQVKEIDEIIKYLQL